jgi:hypothetical protein
MSISIAGCATAPTWRDTPGALEHVPTGLVFPDALDGLAREPGAETAVSYVSSGTTGLRIVLSRMESDAPIDLGAILALDYLYWRRDPGGTQEWRSHEFAPGELEALFDSLQPASPEDVVRFPGMAVSR